MSRRDSGVVRLPISDVSLYRTAWPGFDLGENPSLALHERGTMGRVPLFPPPDLAVTHILVVADLVRSKAWYLDVLGATLYAEYGGTSVVLQLGTTWLLLVTGGGPTDDKPDVTLLPPADPDVRDNLFTMRVEDCWAAYDELRGRGAVFLTPPTTHGAETRCFFCDPDGHLFEISEYRIP